MYGHLSRLIVTDKLERCSRYSVGRTALLTETQSCSEWGLHGILCYHNIGELLPRLSILTASGRHPKVYSRPKPSHKRRFISVALSRRSPSPDVIRHPVLCCSDFPHDPSIPRPYNKLKSLKAFLPTIILYHFFAKNASIFLLFFEKNSRIIDEFRKINSMFHE